MAFRFPGPAGVQQGPALVHSPCENLAVRPAIAPPTPKSVLPMVRSRDDEPLEISDLIDTGDAKFIMAFWHVNFSLPHPAHRAGHFIQRIKRKSHIAGYAAKPPFTYFEAWSVLKGSKRPDLKAERRYSRKILGKKAPHLPKGDDHFGAERLLKGTKGSFVQEGLLMFYEGKLPHDFVRDNPALDEAAGNLFGSKFAPPFWNERGVRRHFELTWDLTGAEHKWQVHMDARILHHDGKAIIKKESRHDFSKGFFAKLLGF